MLQVPMTYAIWGQPNTWRRILRSTDSLLQTAIYTCPNGHTNWIDGNLILPDGTVALPVRCPGRTNSFPRFPQDDCDFKESVHLKNWRSQFSLIEEK